MQTTWALFQDSHIYWVIPYQAYIYIELYLTRLTYLLSYTLPGLHIYWVIPYKAYISIALYLTRDNSIDM